MSITHDLKTLAVYFDAVERGDKTFEIRRDDRGFQKGDTLRLLRLPEADERIYSLAGDPTHGMKTVERRISWILTGGQFGVEPGYVILALDPSPQGEGDGETTP